MDRANPNIHGRGSAENPANRFVRLTVVPDADAPAEETILPRTQFLKDSARSAITCNNSPDIPFEASINPYRGCEHGCAYCYARPTHEYLGFSAGLDFETNIMVKDNAPELLAEELARPSWQPKVLAISGVTDAYQPVERRLQLTRRCLQVLTEFRNPASIVTKNHLVTRDIDVLSEMARHRLVAVFISITTLDAHLARIMEPRASAPHRRLEAIKKLAASGIPAGVIVAPVVPGLTDHELPQVVKAAAEAGATMAGFTPVRLPLAVAPLFEDWLSRHMPERKDKVLNRIRSMRDGKLNDSAFGQRLRGRGPFADQIQQMFDLACRKAGINQDRLDLDTSAFRRPGQQLKLF
jgi:DNA repair photolyase